MSDPMEPKPAGIFRRLGAIVYDTLLVVPLIMFMVAMIMGARAFLGVAGDEILPPIVVQSLAVIACVGFFAVFWLKNGQTLGMQAWRLKLVPMAGNELTFGRAVTRCGAALLSAACFGLGYLWCLVDRRKLCWHDYLSGTELIVLPKRPKEKKP